MPYYPPRIIESRPSAEPPAQLVAASVLVRATTPGGPMYMGSGTVFAASGGYSFILTCDHVVTGSTRFDVTFTNGQRVAAGLLARDDTADLACLYILGESPAIPLAEAVPPPKTVIWQVGYPHGKGPVKRHGYANGLLSTSPGPRGGSFRNLDLAFPVENGDSGSGVFTGDLKLCGVVWGSSPSDSSAVGVDDCWRFVEQRCKIIGLLRGRRPAPKQPAPPLAPSPIVPPGAPPIAQPDTAGLDKLRGELSNLRDLVQWLKENGGKPGPAGPPGPSGPAGPGGSPGRPGQSADPAELGKLKEQIGDTAGKLGPIASTIKDLAPLAGKAAVIAGLESSVSWLPWIVGGVATGGASIPAAIGVYLARRAARAVIERRQQGGSGTTTIVQAPAPDPLVQTIVKEQARYVPIETDDLRLKALQQAMDELARRYPGKINDLEMLKAFADQYESGLRGKKT